MKRVAAIAIMHNHHILMGKRRDNGKWTNPGGHLNAGEDPVKGAVREVKEEVGLDLDPHLLKHLESRIVKKPDGSKLEVHGYRVDLREKPATTIVQDPDEEVQRWQWIKTDSDFDHIEDNLHVPLTDNVLLAHILKDKPMRRHTQRFWDSAKRVGIEGAQQVAQHHDKIRDKVKTLREKKAEMVEGGKADNKPDSDFSQAQINKGKKVEREHTKNPELAKEIAKDHLTEDKKYYDHLKEMEDKYVEKKAFWEGFEKKALMPTKGQELATAGVLGQVPFGTTLHSSIADRPEGHSRGKEWLGRIGGTLAGGIPGAVVGRLAGEMMGDAALSKLLATIGASAGAAAGETIAHNVMISKYYDEKGKLKEDLDKKAGELAVQGTKALAVQGTKAWQNLRGTLNPKSSYKFLGSATPTLAKKWIPPKKDTLMAKIKRGWDRVRD